MPAGGSLLAAERVTARAGASTLVTVEAVKAPFVMEPFRGQPPLVQVGARQPDATTEANIQSAA